MRKSVLSFVVFILISLLSSSTNLFAEDFKVTEKQFNHGLDVLREHLLLLNVRYDLAEGEKEVTLTINSYNDLMSFVKKRKPGKFYLLHEKTDETYDICEMSPDDFKSKGFGQWFWKKVCEAAELGGIMKDCNGFFQWK
ncbi:MAG: hypothetical protein N2319_10415 [Candidatus Kapabacteria bacterium]|nr:hypothetical protein [Candidatus Kapabacteria bacterium]